jgi:hypothetical protein
MSVDTLQQRRFAPVSNDVLEIFYLAHTKNALSMNLLAGESRLTILACKACLFRGRKKLALKFENHLSDTFYADDYLASDLLDRKATNPSRLPITIQRVEDTGRVQRGQYISVYVCIDPVSRIPDPDRLITSAGRPRSMQKLCVGEEYTITAYRTIMYWKKRIGICTLSSKFQRFKIEHKELEHKLVAASNSNRASTTTGTETPTTTTYKLAVPIKFRLLGFKRVRYDIHNYRTVPQLLILRE